MSDYLYKQQAAFIDKRRRDLIREIQIVRLIQQNKPRRPGYAARALARVGDFLIGIGTRLKNSQNTPAASFYTPHPIEISD